MRLHFYRNYIYPYFVDRWGDPPPIQKIRQQIIPMAQGIVLEIGAGSAEFPKSFTYSWWGFAVWPGESPDETEPS